MKYASFWRQISAVIIDQLVILLPSALIPQAYYYYTIASGTSLEVARDNTSIMQLILSVVFMGVYYILLNGKYGVTLGRRLLNVKLIRLDEPNGDGIGYKKAILRALAFVVAGGFIRASSLAGLPIILGVIIDTAFGVTILWMLIDHRRRTMEDAVIGTAIVHDKSGKFLDFDPDSLPKRKIRPIYFGLLVLINTLASIFVALNR